MGFTKIIMPKRNAMRLKEKADEIPEGVNIIGVRGLSDAIQKLKEL